MEGFIKQISILFCGEEENQAQTSRVVRDRKFSSRRTRSSKGDNRKGQNWGRVQFSGETSRDYDKIEGEKFRTAVAAAAFVICSIEDKEDAIKREKHSKSRKTSSEILEASSGPETNGDLPGGGGVNHPTPIVVRTEPHELVSGKIGGSETSVEKTSNFAANKQLDAKTSKKEPELRLGEADIWEKNEMEKIKERFVKLKGRIFEWEKKKKLKAKNKLTREEGKIEWKRARASQDFKEKIETIEKASEAAKVQNEEIRKKEENRVKEKVKMIRSTAKIQKSIFVCC